MGELVAQVQRTPGPRQIEFSPTGQTKFVICDYTIETLFSDQKSRGFHLHKSHLSDPARLSRLLLAASLAYLWMVYLGVTALRQGWYKQFHRSDRVDLSLFQLGLRLLEHMPW